MTTSDDKDAVFLTLGELAPEFGMTRDVLRARLAAKGVAPTAGTRATPLYRLRDVIRGLFEPVFRWRP